MDTSNLHILYVLFLFSLENVFIIIPFQFYIFHFDNIRFDAAVYKEKFDDSKGENNCSQHHGRTKQTRLSTIYKTLHRKLKFEQNQPHKKRGWTNPCSPEG